MWQQTLHGYGAAGGKRQPSYGGSQSRLNETTKTNHQFQQHSKIKSAKKSGHYQSNDHAENTYELDHEDVDFLTMVCQEMRPSLHDVMRISRLFSESETPLDAENQNCVRATLASAEMMLSVVDNILSCLMVKATMN